jgi:hypothetical protein
MNTKVTEALSIYGQYLDTGGRMSTAVVEAIRTLRVYAHECDPANEEIPRILISARKRGLSGEALAALMEEIGRKKRLVHHVFFWLKNPRSKEDLAQLLRGLNSLRQIDVIRELHIGVPADTEQRAVVDATYNASEMMLFDDVAAQKIYQDHPLHKKFVADCSHLWERVVVYDSIDVES